MSELRDDLMATVTQLQAADTDQGTDDTTLENNNDGQQQEAEPGAGERQPQEGRDASGRFTPKTPAKDPIPSNQEPGTEDPLKTGVDPTQQQQTQQPAQTTKAPASWKPEEREGWDKLDPRHQQAVLRREREITQTLAQTAGMRQFANEVARTLDPYLPMIQAEGSNPVRAIGEVMKTAALLRTAPPQQKALAVGDMILQFGVDLKILDQYLTAKMEGKSMPQGGQDLSGIEQLIQRQLAPVQEFMGTIQQQRQQAAQRVTQQAAQTLDQFMQDPANEFAEDVREDMADLLDMAANRGVTLSLQDAYKRATMAHPTISMIVARRAAQATAAQQTAAAQRARNASVSPSNSGAPAQSDDGEGDGSLRSDIMSSVKSLASRR